MDVLANDAEGSGLWLPRFQADDDVVPARVRSLSNVGTAGIGLGMGVAVCTPNDLEAIGLGSQFGTKVLLGVDRVHHGAVSDVGARDEPHDFRGCGVADEQATHLLGVAGNAVRSHCGCCFSGHRNEVLG